MDNSNAKNMSSWGKTPDFFLIFVFFLLALNTTDAQQILFEIYEQNKKKKIADKLSCREQRPVL